MSQFNFAGFNACHVFQMGIDDTDLHLLSYMQMIIANEPLEYIIEDGVIYYFISYEKIIMDNLYLNLKKRGMENRLAVLEKKNLISKKTKTVDGRNKTYVKIMPLFAALQQSHFDEETFNTILEKREEEIKKKEETKQKECSVISKTKQEFIDKFTDNESLKKAIISFVEMRKKLKHEMTDHALDLMLRKLGRLSNQAEMQEQIINQSILHSWTDIYALQESKSKNQQFDYGKECDF